MSIKSNSFVAAAEQVCIEPVLEHRQRQGRRNIAWQAIPHLCCSSRKGTTSCSIHRGRTNRSGRAAAGARPIIRQTIFMFTHTHTHTHPFNGPFPGLPRSAGTRKVKPIWILLKQETVSGSGISWAICKSAPRSRQITMPAPHRSVCTDRMPFLPRCRPTNSVKALKELKFHVRERDMNKSRSRKNAYMHRGQLILVKIS